MQLLSVITRDMQRKPRQSTSSGERCVFPAPPGRKPGVKSPKDMPGLLIAPLAFRAVYRS